MHIRFYHKSVFVCFTRPCLCAKMYVWTQFTSELPEMDINLVRPPVRQMGKLDLKAPRVLQISIVQSKRGCVLSDAKPGRKYGAPLKYLPSSLWVETGNK